MNETDIGNILKIGENDQGYYFAVGKIHGRWFGFAVGDLDHEQTGVWILPGMGEGHELGVKNRAQAIKLTGAIAQSGEHGYGGISRWFVPEELRGKPEDLVCNGCGSVGCPGDCFDYMGEYFGQVCPECSQPIETLDGFTSCACEDSGQWYEGNYCARCGERAVNCFCPKGFAFDERDR